MQDFFIQCGLIKNVLYLLCRVNNLGFYGAVVPKHKTKCLFKRLFDFDIFSGDV